MTARSTANLLSIQANTAILFYHKIRLIIEHHLSQQADEIFDEQVELNESYFGGHRKREHRRGATSNHSWQ